jgi:plastocyanin
MRRDPTAARALMLGCAGALGAAAAIAATALGSSGGHRHARPALECKTSSRAHRHHSRHAARCPGSHHGATHNPSSTSTGGSPSAGHGAAGSTTSPTAAPTGGGAQPQGGEANPPPQGPPSIPHVQVTAVEYRFALSRTTVPAGKVIVQFVNHGQDEHNLNLLSEGTLAGSFQNTASHGTAQEQLELRPGTYTLFCSLPEHEQKGMKATLVVQ